MKTIEYHQDGVAIADHACSMSARMFLTMVGDQAIKVSTDNFIYEVCALIAEKFISHEEVVFLFEGKSIAPNAGGRLQEWPQGFCDITEKALYRILKATSKVIK